MSQQYRLMAVPAGWKVVPEEPTEDMLSRMGDYAFPANKYKGMLKAAPQPDTPPVLRWEGVYLMFYEMPLVFISEYTGGKYFYDGLYVRSQAVYETEQEARRAAERALGFLKG